MDEDERKAHDRRLRERFAFVAAAKADSGEGRADMIKLRDLLPCPFCGGPPSIEMTRGNGRVVYCASDDCMGPHTAAANLEDATLQWNKRPALPPLRVREEIAREIEQAWDAATPPFRRALVAADAILSRTAGQEWRDISTRPDGDEPCWIAHAPSKTRVVGYPARGLPKGAWRLMWTAKILSWTPTHWSPLPAPPVAEPLLADKSPE